MVMAKSHEQLAEDHRRCAMAMHGKTLTRRFDSPTHELITMTEAVYHATMAVLYQLKTQDGSTDDRV
jgi:hypothetical protein